MFAQLDAPTLLPILEMLADGEMHGLSALAERADLPLATLEGALPQLSDHGARRRGAAGLQVPGGLALLRDGFREAVPGLAAVQVRGVTGSTNDDVRSAAADGATLPLAVLAEAQVSGRGRRGRAWSSPVASNIYVSLGFELADAEAARGLSLAVGVVLAEALEAATGHQVALKWPNDLLLDERKLGGVLVELHNLRARTVAIVGAGINVRVPGYAARAIDQAFAQLTDGGVQVARAELARRLVTDLAALAGSYPGHGFDAGLRERWSRRDAFRGRRVRAAWGDDSLEGMAAGIDVDGELLLDTPAGRRRIGGGEVSLRPLAEA